MVVYGTVYHRQDNVDKDPKMCHSSVTSCLYVAPSQKDGALIRKTRILHGHVFAALWYGMLSHKGLGTQYCAGIIEPRQTASVLRGPFQRVDLIITVFPARQLDNYESITIISIYRVIHYLRLTVIGWIVVHGTWEFYRLQEGNQLCGASLIDAISR